jgi:hypothetical protein
MFILISILAIIGALVVAAAAIACIVLVYERIAPSVHKAHFDSGCAYVRGMLRCDSHWFSEDPPTKNVLHNLASGMEVGQARGQWNRERLFLMAKRRLDEHTANVAEQEAGNRAEELSHPNEEGANTFQGFQGLPSPDRDGMDLPKRSVEKFLHIL